MKAVEARQLAFTYRRSEAAALDGVSLDVEQGRLVLIMGKSGSGKSSLIRCLNNIIPRFFQGAFSGALKILDEHHAAWRTCDFAGIVGMVFQDFESQLFSTNAAFEVAFGVENLGVPREEMIERVASAFKAVGLVGFEKRDPTTLSGGQKQRLAIASVLAMQPKILVLDEATTDLDPVGKREIFEIVDRLSEEAGLTILMVEHETEHARKADEIIVMNEGRIVRQGPPSAILSDQRLLAGNSMRPLQVHQIFVEMNIDDPPDAIEAAHERLTTRGVSLSSEKCDELQAAERKRSEGYGREIILARGLRHRYGEEVEALRGVGVSIREGEFVAVLGQNGSGKTTLVKHFNGLLQPTSGTVTFDGADVSTQSPASLGRRIGYVFQNPDHQIFSATVKDEVAFGPRNFGFSAEEVRERVATALGTVGLTGYDDRDPFVLTKGERQRIAVASILASEPRVIILDEPTTGLDYAEQVRMMDLIRTLNESGHTIIIITHSMWVAAEYAHRAIMMADGSIVADGSVRDVFANHDALGKAALIAPDVVQLSQEFGVTLLSTKEFLHCAQQGKGK